jgi:2-iminobutanoate/2-iminopropanoate deaminase
MAKGALLPQGVPPIDGPFSQAVRTDPGQMIFMAGQVALDGEGQLVGKGDIRAQTRQVLENIRALVEAGGGSMDDVMSMTIFVVDIEQREEIARVRSEYWSPAYYPTSTMVEVRSLVSEQYLVEINAVAVLGS